MTTETSISGSSTKFRSDVFAGGEFKKDRETRQHQLGRAITGDCGSGGREFGGTNPPDGTLVCVDPAGDCGVQDVKINGVLETCMYVDDLAVAEQFYGETLGLEFVSRKEGRHVFFRIGNSMLLIFDPRKRASASSSRPSHGAIGPSHVAFSIAQNDLPAWQARLDKAGVAIEQTVDWPSGGRSLYFRDPAGNSLELTSPTIWGGSTAIR
jgi:catechol 2,3-dioxygenase-like lactoylglutathione lyase family enzyme